MMSRLYKIDDDIREEIIENISLLKSMKNII